MTAQLLLINYSIFIKVGQFCTLKNVNLELQATQISLKIWSPSISPTICFYYMQKETLVPTVWGVFGGQSGYYPILCEIIW
jgi:hypothetical protein